MSTLNEAMQIAVRFNYQKMAPLGIADDDYRRVAMSLDLSEDGVKELCQQFKAQNKAAASELFPNPVHPTRECRICFIGDSITSERTSYMNILRTAFEDQSNVLICDCAISGWKTSDVIFEFEGYVPGFKPDIVHIMLGTNDARNAFPDTDSSAAGLSGYRRNITQIIETVKKLGAAVIVTTIPPTKPSPALDCGIVPVWETKDFNDILRDVCKQANVPLNDMESTLTAELDGVIDTFDHVHLSAYGQKLMAKSVYPYLAEEMMK